MAFSRKENNMLIGYARISTHDQNLDLQNDALKKAGCNKIFQDVCQGKNFERKGLFEAIDYMRKGDCLVVWKLDRLGRSLKDLLKTINGIHDKGVGFKSLQEEINTTTSSGKLTFHIFGALAEFEKDIIRDRTMAGLKAARARGRLGGRPSIMNPKKIKMAKTLMANNENSIREICKTLKISRTTLYRHVKPVPFKPK